MNIPISTPLEIKRDFAASHKTRASISNMRDAARNIITRRDPRVACVIGPCSIHEKTSALEYARRFKELALEVQDTCFLVMRVYFEKPRTSTGWKGWLYDPHLDGSNDMHTGLLWTRELLLTLAEFDIPIAAEFVDPLAAVYFEDLVTWGFIGARTSASQPHRQFASSLNIPIGFKNGTDGNLDDAVNGVSVSCAAHTFLAVNDHGQLTMTKSHGNPFSHIVLRGSYDATNYDSRSIAQAIEKLQKAHLHPRILIDCAHGNCQKQYGRQIDAFQSVLEQLEQGNEALLGFMLESHLESGYQPLRQDPTQLKYAVSITDPCIDWETTETLILSAHNALDLSISVSK